jgi:hypothetical protein
MRNTAVIMQDGIHCLLEKLGAYETEVFVWNLLKEQFDYTEWKKVFFRNGNLDDFNRNAAEFDKQNPFGIKVGE